MREHESPAAYPELVEGSTPTLALPRRRGRGLMEKSRISLVRVLMLQVALFFQVDHEDGEGGGGDTGDP